jgi:hypothetical protein
MPPGKPTSSLPSLELPKSHTELLKLYVSVLDALQELGITRSNNIPTGDYAEYLVSRHFGAKLESNAFKGYDLRLTDTDRTRVQVKARRVRASGTYGNFGFMRNLAGCAYRERQFDFLVAVVFEYDFEVREAWWIPWRVVKKHAGYSTTVGAARLTRIGSLISGERGVHKLDLSERATNL